MRPIIRKAKKQDIEEITSMLLELNKSHDKFNRAFFKRKKNARGIFKKFAKKAVTKRDWLALVATENGKYLGYCISHKDRVPPVYKCQNQMAVSDIYVRKKYRGKGIGKILLQEVQKWAKKKGARFLTLSMDTKNRKAASLYEKFGFSKSRYTMHKKVK